MSDSEVNVPLQDFNDTLRKRDVKDRRKREPPHYSPNDESAPIAKETLELNVDLL